MLIKIDSRNVTSPSKVLPGAQSEGPGICGAKIQVSREVSREVAGEVNSADSVFDKAGRMAIKTGLNLKAKLNYLVRDEKGDVPGWVLVVLMTTGLVTAIWTIAAPKLTSILRNSLDAMNGVH